MKKLYTIAAAAFAGGLALSYCGDSEKQSIGTPNTPSYKVEMEAQPKISPRRSLLAYTSTQNPGAEEEIEVKLKAGEPISSLQIEKDAELWFGRFDDYGEGGCPDEDYMQKFVTAVDTYLNQHGLKAATSFYTQAMGNIIDRKDADVSCKDKHRATLEPVSDKLWSLYEDFYAQNGKPKVLGDESPFPMSLIKTMYDPMPALESLIDPQDLVDSISVNVGTSVSRLLVSHFRDDATTLLDQADMDHPALDTALSYFKASNFKNHMDGLTPGDQSHIEIALERQKEAQDIALQQAADTACNLKEQEGFDSNQWLTVIAANLRDLGMHGSYEEIENVLREKADCN